MSANIFTFCTNEMSIENEGLESMIANFRSNVLPTILVDLDQASHDVFGAITGSSSVMNHRRQNLSAKVVVAHSIIVQFKWSNAPSNLKLLPIVLISIVAKWLPRKLRLNPFG